MHYLNLQQRSIISEKSGYLSEKLKTLTSNNYRRVQYFLLKRFLLTNIKLRMFSRNSIYLLPRDGAFSTYINGSHECVSRYKSYYQKDILSWIGQKILLRCHAWPKHPRFNISVKQNLPFPDSRIGAFEPPLFSTIITGILP